MIVCVCRRVSDSAIRAALDAGAATADDVARATGASTECGCCRPAVEAIVQAHAACASPPCAGCPRAADVARRRGSDAPRGPVRAPAAGL